MVARGRANGLDAVGIAGAEPFERTRVDLEERRAAGLNADMQFTYRDPARSTDPSRTLPGARSIVVGAVRYASDLLDEPGSIGPASDGAASSPPSGGAVVGPLGRVARYATGDHDAVLRGALAHQQSAAWAVGAGAVLASTAWFSALGFGATRLAPLFSRPRAWQVLDLGVAAVMATLAVGLVVG